ncbi:MAG: hypothetical protein WCL08_10215, partial [Verrucomicrobiota bacterium]
MQFRLPSIFLIGLCATLNACGGGSGGASGSSGGSQSFTVSGSVSGLNAGESLILKNNSAESLTISVNGAFSFKNQIPQNGSYSVTVDTQPIGEVCTVSGGTGSGVMAPVNGVSVKCSVDTYNISGMVSGLNPTQQLVLSDNAADQLTISANGAFTFPVPIAYGGGYSVTVTQQPSAEMCTVSNGAGSGVQANVSNIVVNCAIDTYTISGSVSGLATGQQVTLYNNGGDPLIISANGSFTFPTLISFGSSYSVSVNTQPTGEICTVSNGSGTNVVANISNVLVTCSIDTYTISGTLSGLNPGQSLTLYNNLADPLTLTTNGLFAFPTSVSYGGSYSVSVSSQPIGQICVVTAGSGSNVTAPVSGVSVNCSSVSPGGIWEGTESVTGLSIKGLVTESGDMRFIRADGTQYVGSVVTQGNALTGTFTGYLPSGFFYTDGSNHGTGTISGQVNPRQSVTATTNFSTANGTKTTGTLSLSYNKLYENGSSLSALAGTYIDPSTGDSVSIST